MTATVALLALPSLGNATTSRNNLFWHHPRKPILEIAIATVLSNIAPNFTNVKYP